MPSILRPRTLPEVVREYSHVRAALAATLQVSSGRDLLRVIIARSGWMSDPLENNPGADPHLLAVQVGWQGIGRELMLAIAEVDETAYASMLAESVQEGLYVEQLARAEGRSDSAGPDYSA